MAKRIDANQGVIVRAFRDMGASVQILSSVGKGCPDLIVGVFGINLLVEIKDGDKPPSQRKLTEHEKHFHESWKGQVCIIQSVDDAFMLIKEMNKRN